MRTSKFATRLFLLITAVAIVPVVFLLGISLKSSMNATETTAREALQEISKHVAARVEEDIQSYIKLVDGLAETIQRPFLDLHSKKMLLDGYLRFREMKRAAVISLPDNKLIITNDPGWKELEFDSHRWIDEIRGDNTAVSDLFWREGVLPTIRVARRLPSSELLLVEINIAHLWKIVDDISVGDTGRILLLDSKGSVIAHGAAYGKEVVLGQGEKANIRRDFVRPTSGTPLEYEDRSGQKVVGVAHEVPSVHWKVLIEQDREEAYAGSRSLIPLLSFSTVIFILLVILVGTRWSRAAARPLEQLAAATRAVAQGDFSVEVPVHGSDERAQLSQAFNQMVRDLERLHQEIAYRERMSVLGRIASELIHDLRHPIRNIENAADLLNQRGAEKEVREMFQRVTQREFEGLNRFLTNLEQLTVEPEPTFISVNLDEELISLIDAHLNTPEGKDRIIRMTGNGSPASIVTDRFLLRRILQNLLRNALEATPPGGEIEVKIWNHDPVEIHVSDSGPGIPEEQLPSLFTALHTTKRRGLGLGLAICRKLTSELGGRIEAKNAQTGGAVFTVILPRRASITGKQAYATASANRSYSAEP